jgi:DNA-binding MurR/RpiR family transcriptional regulator
MNLETPFEERLKAGLESMSPAELRVSRYFQDNREEVLFASASALAKKAGTSDATVIRTAKALGFSGMEELRRTLAAELRENLSPATRLAGTLGEVGDDLQAAFNVTLNIHQKAIEDLRRDVTPEQFETAVQFISGARRLLIFGIGPSSAMATYFEIQLGRFGIEALSLTQTGLLLADGLQKLRKGDLLVVFAYSRVYRELATLLDHADRCGVKKILITDTLGGTLGQHVDLVLSVARGRADLLSMHTATLGLIEALLVGLATTRPEETMTSLRSLNQLRTELVGKSMGLPEH